MKVELETAFSQSVQLNDQDFGTIATFMYRETGIVLNDSKRAMVVSRLTRRLRELGLTNFSDYCELIQSRWGASERASLISSLTTNVTHFFREPSHFDDLRENVFPELLERAHAGKRIRIWSAGCSTGQEVYSLGVSLLNMCPTAADLDIRILGTDIDPEVVKAARAGVYTRSQLDQMPVEGRHFFRSDNDALMRVTAGAELKRLVAFRVLNLMSDWPVKGPFEVIMCRNVTIYFDRPTQQRLWQRFSRLIPSGGRLYVGHSEFRVEDAGTQYDAGTAGVFIRKANASLLDSPTNEARLTS